MLDGVLTAARIQGIAVGQKGDSARLLYHVCHSLGVIGPQIADISQLAKMYLDGYEFSFHVHGGKAGFFHQPFQLRRKSFSEACPEICKIHL